MILRNQAAWSPRIRVAEPHTIVLNTLVIVDMAHLALTIHEHEAVVTDELSDHVKELLVVHKRRVLSNRRSHVVLDEVPCVGLGNVSGIACVQDAVVHHRYISRHDIVWVAVVEVGMPVCSPAEVNGQLAVIVG